MLQCTHLQLSGNWVELPGPSSTGTDERASSEVEIEKRRGISHIERPSGKDICTIDVVLRVLCVPSIVSIMGSPTESNSELQRGLLSSPNVNVAVYRVIMTRCSL